MIKNESTLKNRIIADAIEERLINNESDLSLSEIFFERAYQHSKDFLDIVPDINAKTDVEIVRIFRYYMCKAAETYIHDVLYADNQERICNITYDKGEFDTEYFSINVPNVYIWTLSDLSMHYLMPLYRCVQYLRQKNIVEESVRNAILYWQIIAYTNASLRDAARCNGQYEPESIKTLDEIRIPSIEYVGHCMTKQGWLIEQTNYLMSSKWNIQAWKDNEKYAILVRTNHGHSEAGITKCELWSLLEYAHAEGCHCGYILVKTNSVQESHAKDKVILLEDEMQFHIEDSAFIKNNPQ